MEGPGKDAWAERYGKAPRATLLTGVPGPEEALRRVLHLPLPALLLSGSVHAVSSRYSYLCAGPDCLLTHEEGMTYRHVRGGGTWHRTRMDVGPFDALRRELEARASEVIPGIPPFQGGAVGYLGYELGGVLERVPVPDSPAGPGFPAMHLAFYDQVLAWDHARGEAWFFHSGEGAAFLLEAIGGSTPGEGVVAGPGFPETRSGAAPAGMPTVRSPGRPTDAGEHPAAPEASWPDHPVPAFPGWRSTFSPSEYVRTVEEIRRRILEGEVFQANLSQAFHRRWSGDPVELLGALVRKHPAPYTAYLALAEGVVLSASPEQFLRVDRGRVTTRPIKGTAPRVAEPELDRAARTALARSAKDRAENTMIVDLLRNDLSRVCTDESVEVTGLCEVESHPTVHHLVSTVEGTLRPGMGAVELLEATFPCGSITGAPKLRAMEILAELEPTTREVYTGAIGWIGADGGLELSVAIRTLSLGRGMAWLPAGGGVILDSDGRAEYQETLEKARGLIQLLEDR